MLNKRSRSLFNQEWGDGSHAATLVPPDRNPLSFVPMNNNLRFPRGLYGVTPEWTDADKLDQAVRAAARGGMTGLQLRHKTATSAWRKALARRLRDTCQEYGVVFMINDDWRLALEIGADGVHVGREDDAPALVRREIGPKLLLGVSCYADTSLATKHLAHDVDYIAFGAMFSSQTKPLAPPAPLSVLTDGQTLCQAMPHPRPAVVAIGGIGVAQADSVIRAGADTIAVVGGLFASPNIEETARTFSAKFQNAHTKT
jgi:thiamine-phosphate pyrophosphorylase